MSDHPEIWLEPKCAEDNHPEGRQWCQDNVFEMCPECGENPTRYIRADIVEAERQRHAKVMEEVRKVLGPICAGAVDVSGTAIIIGYPEARATLEAASALLSKLGGENV